MNAVFPIASKSPFPFVYAKGAEAAATILRQESHGEMNYHRLLKLLYIIDRVALGETGRPIIGGRLIALQRGPLHSRCLDLIQGRDSESPAWMNHFQTQQYQIVMVTDPGNRQLSKREIDIINCVRNEHLARDEWELGEFMLTFAEYAANRPTEGDSREIPFAQLLAAVGRAADQAEIEKDAQEKAAFDRVFEA